MKTGLGGQLMLVSVVGPLCLIAGLVTFVFASRLRSIAVGMIVAGVLVMLKVRRLMKTVIDYARLAEPWRYEITETDLKVTTGAGTVEFPWAVLARVREQAEFWILDTQIKDIRMIELSAYRPPIEKRSRSIIKARSSIQMHRRATAK
ncbi:MAG TPA: hypothetical protein VFC19_48250 [Candidatus Limnocylindrales bacterium]|nr:hypothetical protein [Candidatus Limnocylindrales bacterium]